ncbi:glutaredoxin [Peribacillus deserti]|uniref:Glutaredoxin n=1 Tax=Peribacillus deserti TaxID=673318 RepID=A0ABS2QPJ3_9BACI|nr:glutaredoxin family protein [Peribacillus deserti]MBM7694609.1 glutaredoxin [Peribacillus deserti]
MTEVILFTQPECPPCEFFKLFLKDHGVRYQEKNIKSDPKARHTLIHTYHSYSTPTLVIDGSVYTSVQMDEIKAALGLS